MILSKSEKRQYVGEDEAGRQTEPTVLEIERGDKWIKPSTL